MISRQLGNEILVPARDVLHLKLDAPPDREPWPLMGQSPLASIASELMTRPMRRETAAFGGKRSVVGQTERHVSSWKRGGGTMPSCPLRPQEADEDMRASSG